MWIRFFLGSLKRILNRTNAVCVSIGLLGKKAVVLATDLTDNPGCKIANVTKELIHFTSHIYDLAPCKIMLVEHYSSNEFLDEDIYLQVLLTNNEVIRQKIDKSKLNRINWRSFYRQVDYKKKEAGSYANHN